MSFSSPDKIPDSIRQKIREQHAHDPAVLAAAGFGPQSVGVTSSDKRQIPTDKAATPSGKRPRQRARKCWVGPISFDSETEAAVYVMLRQLFPAVFVHPKLALSDDARTEPDFIAVEEVLEDGRFIGRVIDAKAFKRNKRGGKCRAIVQEDAAVKAKWLKEKTGLVLQIRGRKGEIE